MQEFFGTDKIAFDITSTRFPTTPRHYDSFSDALDEVIDARVWGGIHFRTADEQGAALGKKVALWEKRHYFQPVRRHHGCPLPKGDDRHGSSSKGEIEDGCPPSGGEDPHGSPPPSGGEDPHGSPPPSGGRIRMALRRHLEARIRMALRDQGARGGTALHLRARGGTALHLRATMRTVKADGRRDSRRGES